MGAYTYLSDHESAAGRQTGDKNLDEVLRDANSYGDNWRVLSRTFRPKKRWFRREPEAVTHYTLYWYTGRGIEYQVINLCTPLGGSVFHGSSQSKEDIANFLMGYCNGQHAAALSALGKKGAGQ